MLQFQLSQNQVSQIAQVLSSNLNDIQEVLKNNEFKNELIENKVFKKYSLKKSFLKQTTNIKKFDTKHYSIWKRYKNTTICIIKEAIK